MEHAVSGKRHGLHRHTAGSRPSDPLIPDGTPIGISAPMVEDRDYCLRGLKEALAVIQRFYDYEVSGDPSDVTEFRSIVAEMQRLLETYRGESA